MAPRSANIDRAPEKVHHFNAAYVGALVGEFVREYQAQRRRPAPFALVCCALPIALHRETRNRLPRSTRTSLFAWLEDNPEARVGFADRAANLLPYVRKGLIYAGGLDALRIGPEATVTLGAKRTSFRSHFFDSATSDVQDTVRAVRLVGRWFAKAGDAATILCSWGIRL